MPSEINPSNPSDPRDPTRPDVPPPWTNPNPNPSTNMTDAEREHEREVAQEREHQQVPFYDRGSGGSRWRERLVAGSLCLVVGLAGGFGIGRKTAPKATATASAARGAFPGGFGNGQAPPGQGQNGSGSGSGSGSGQGTQAGGGPTVQGTIAASSGGVLTITTQAGQIKVKLSSATTISKAVAGKAADLTVGKTVAVRLNPAATNGSDGTVSATSITAESAQ